MKSLINYFDCGRVEFLKDNTVHYIVTKFDDITQKIIPFFLQYPIRGVKAQDFSDWCKVAEMMKEKKTFD